MKSHEALLCRDMTVLAQQQVGAIHPWITIKPAQSLVTSTVTRKFTTQSFEVTLMWVPARRDEQVD